MHTNKKKQSEKLEILLKKLPDFCDSYMKARALKISLSTSISYANDFLTFFYFLIRKNHYYHNYKPKDFKISDLNGLTVEDIDAFIQDQQQNNNVKTSIYRRLSAISTLYDYLLKRRLVSHNPVTLVERKKENKKPVIHLEDDESERFLATISTGTGLTNREKSRTPILIRDMAIFVMFLNNGFRISELQSIDIKDINFDGHYVGIIRKGGDYQRIYLADTTEDIIKRYLNIRKEFIKEDMLPEDKDALFLSQKGNRISVRQIQTLTKKYLGKSVPEKMDIITPHKLRSTFAMDYYAITQDVLSLQKILGHSNIQTTNIYAQATENSIRDTRNVIERKRIYE